MVSGQQSRPKRKASVSSPPTNQPQQKQSVFNVFENNSTTTTETQVAFDNNENIRKLKEERYFESFPPGYRFCPEDWELIEYYLVKKLRNEILPPNKIHEVTLYDFNPEDLIANHPIQGEKELYFYTPRDRKYKNGTRPNRAAGGGYWKATGADKRIKHNGVVIGFRKALVFYRGKAPKGAKTNWIMHEYRVSEPPQVNTGANGMRLDDCVLCRVYEKDERDKKEEKDEEEGEAIGNSEESIHLNEVDEMNYNYDTTDLSSEFMYTHPCNLFQLPIDNGFREIPTSSDRLLFTARDFSQLQIENEPEEILSCSYDYVDKFVNYSQHPFENGSQDIPTFSSSSTPTNIVGEPLKHVAFNDNRLPTHQSTESIFQPECVIKDPSPCEPSGLQDDFQSIRNFETWMQKSSSYKHQLYGISLCNDTPKLEPQKYVPPK